MSHYRRTINVREAEETFNEIKNLGYPLSTFICDQMLPLYHKFHNKKKMADVLLLMEKENLMPSLATYKIMIDIKGSSDDITGMEKIVDTMKSEGVELDVRAQFLIARSYASAGLIEKAEKVLREIEGENLEENLHVCSDLIYIYGSLKRADEVTRIWEIWAAKFPSLYDFPWYETVFVAAILAFGKIGKVKEAEAVFEKISYMGSVSSSVYSVLLRVYVNHKMVSEGKDLIEKMTDTGCKFEALMWDAVIQLYVEAEEVEMVEYTLSKLHPLSSALLLFIKKKFHIVDKLLFN